MNLDQNRDQNGDQNQFSPDIVATMEVLRKHPKVEAVLESIRATDNVTIQDQIEICEINAPSHHEQARGIDFKRRLIELGLEDVQIDEVGNVLGFIHGDKEGPVLLLSAHLDTVFDLDTDTKVRHEAERLCAPGISDNTRGLAEILAVARAIKSASIELMGTLVVCGNVCEEGEGDLKGIKHLFRDNAPFDGYMTPDGGYIGRVRYKGTGSHRYRVTYQCKGGHSFNDFGNPSAVHAMGRAIASISDLVPPEHPKTTFTVGVVSGGTSINSIAGHATMLLDIRSNAHDALLSLESEIVEKIKAAVEQENNRWQRDAVAVHFEMIGDRPSGALEPSEPIVQVSCIAAELLGHAYEVAEAGSTDANYPISLGIPAIQVGFGGRAGGVHTLEEWYEPKGSYQGPQKHFLTTLALLGVKGISNPILKKRK
ncbi:M20/M25/M40 family metallo-hydrolase [Fusibacter ferrireducens]|uniref:M20/M25/M40 family metallo-hydrolase n=1 Tax=Fusibacter ferrireducens TaxID=2785058 RepID=A0ABR9ZPS4_9FIRM|nr:M20/M25/M40 family metallo-hydrolase [Fusibacter ferrireducens]MBF4692442.1 M20/M25/M40 family metallo-hydrolase [Fusibacter ferrireducens]